MLGTDLPLARGAKIEEPALGLIQELEAEMLAAADAMEFERAAALRDRIVQLKNQMGKELSEAEVKSYQPTGKKRGGKRERVPRPKK